MITFGLVGNGFVGKATRVLESKESVCLIYDIDASLCSPKGTTMENLVMLCDLIFVSVPTPMKPDGSCYSGIVESVVSQLKKLMRDHSTDIPIIVRSTVVPGTCDRLGIYFMPEFLTEKNYIEDFINNKDWIIGTPKSHNKHKAEKLQQLLTIAKQNRKIKSDSLTVVLNSEAELAKYCRNSFLALKISFCNEIYQFCEKQNIDYKSVRHLMCLDSRITDSHTQVPGHDGHFGYGGTCFPKDINALSYVMKSCGVKCPVLKSSITRNKSIDRQEKDWEADKGRAVL